MKLCKICQKEVKEKIFKYCLECRTKWDKASDHYYHITHHKSKEYKKNAIQRSRKWQKENPEKFKETKEKYIRELQYQTLLFYSNNSEIPKCVNCGDTNIKVLAIDHINNDGKLDRQRPNELYRKALKIKDKSQYQTLCYNCNWKKHLANLKSKWKYEKMNIRLRRIANNRKLKCISHYSNNLNKCCQCGNSDMEVLCLDHINNDGNEQRKQLNNGKNKGGAAFYRWLIKNNYPSQLQVLCLNCNINKQRMAF